MRIEDFSEGFDILLHSYAAEAGFGEDAFKGTISLNEHEKSVFLTKAQEDIVLELYTGRNNYRESFETTEEMRRILSILVKEVSLDPITSSSELPLGIDSNSKFFTLPEDLWFITYESAVVSDGKCGEGSKLEIYPVRQDEYHVIKKNPFRGANDRRVLRLDLSEGIVELVSKYTVSSYYVRYLRKPKPIVLIDLSNDDMAINGVSNATPCEFHESLHQRILERAVMLALQSRGYTTNKENK